MSTFFKKNDNLSKKNYTYKNNSLKLKRYALLKHFFVVLLYYKGDTMIKKKNMIQSLALAGLMTAINALIILISSFAITFLLADLLLILFFPFISTFTFIFCEKRMALCYFFASLAICFLINFEKALYYLVPSLLSGLLFALMIKKKVHGLYIIIITFLANYIIMWGLFWISEWFFKISMSAAFQVLFSLTEAQARTLFPIFIAITSLAQTIITSLIIFSEMKKFDVFIYFNDSPIKWLLYGGLICSFISGIIMYFLKDIASFFLAVGLIISLPSLYYILKQKRYWMLIVLSFTLLFGVAIFLTLLPGYGYLCISYWTLVLAIFGIYCYKYAHFFK